MGRHLLVDGGQSGCRIVYVVDGERVGKSSVVGLSRHARDRTTGLSTAIGLALRDLRPRPTAVDAVVAGLTGFDHPPEEAREISDGIRALLRVGRVIVSSDAVTSYLGALGFAPGAVVAAGTGIIALAGDGRGNFARADGWGYILGDDGGGYYVGRRGLAGALRAHDGRSGGSDVLLRRARTVYGSPENIKARVYAAENPASEVARFAPEVAGAAREGDPVAQEIWADAAHEAASTATGALRRIFGPDSDVTVSWTGNLFRARDLLLETFEQHLIEMWPSARTLAPQGNALDGAELLARSSQSPMFGALIHVFES